MGSSSKERRSLRWSVLQSGMLNYCTSPLFLSIIALSVSGAILLITNRAWPLGVSVAITAFFYQRVMFEFFVMIHIIESSLGTWTWFNKIDDSKYLPHVIYTHLYMYIYIYNYTLYLAFYIYIYIYTNRSLSGRYPAIIHESPISA